MKKLLLLFLLIAPISLTAQSYSLLKDSVSLKQVKNITENIYNGQHTAALQGLNKLRSRVPQSHPVYPMLQALNLYWKGAPMHSASPLFAEFRGYLNETVSRSEEYLDREQDETIVYFLALSAHSLLTRFHADNGDYMAAVGEAKNAYYYMKKGFDLTDEYTEFIFPVGLYNYYREKYPELHPVYKPFMWFFRSGDKQKGIEQLKYASHHNVFTKPESGVFLAQIYLYYENKPADALQTVRSLQRQYPQNRFFRLLYAEALIANGLYSSAQSHIEFLLAQQDPYYKMSGELFRAISLEKQDKNFEQAQRYYLQALKTAEPLSYMADVFRSMAYAGLGRYHHYKQEPAKARASYKKALELAYFEYPVKPEAQSYLR